jgi:hypothetical protein
MSTFREVFRTCGRDSCVFCFEMKEFFGNHMNPGDVDHIRSQITWVDPLPSIEDILFTIGDGEICRMTEIPDIRFRNGTNLYAAVARSTLILLYERELEIFLYSRHVPSMKEFFDTIDTITHMVTIDPIVMARIFDLSPLIVRGVIDRMKTVYPLHIDSVIEGCLKLLATRDEKIFNPVSLMMNIEILCQNTRRSNIGTKLIDTSGMDYDECCKEIDRFLSLI